VDTTASLSCRDEGRITSFTLDVTTVAPQDDGRVAWAGTFAAVGADREHTLRMEGSFDVLLEPTE
jgi:hypothetical protein